MELLVIKTGLEEQGSKVNSEHPGKRGKPGKMKLLDTKTLAFPAFPGWLFGPSQHPPGNPGKRGNGGSDLPGKERFNKSLVALSREGVVSSHSVIATGLCSRHGVEFGTLRVCQFCRQEAVESAIVGAPKCLQNSALATLKHSEGPRGAASCFGATRAARAALFAGRSLGAAGRWLASWSDALRAALFAGRSLGSCWTVARELLALQLLRGS